MEKKKDMEVFLFGNKRVWSNLPKEQAVRYSRNQNIMVIAGLFLIGVGGLAIWINYDTITGTPLWMAVSTELLGIFCILLALMARRNLDKEELRDAQLQFLKKRTK